MEKICNKCKIKKDVSEFYKRKGRGDGLSGYMYKCKSCNRKTSREYNKKEGSFEKKEYMKEYREKNKEKLKDYINNWRVENIDKFQSGRRDYYQNNKDLRSRASRDRARAPKHSTHLRSTHHQKQHS